MGFRLGCSSFYIIIFSRLVLKQYNISIIGVATSHRPEAALIVDQNPAEPSATQFFHGRSWPSTWELKHERDYQLPHPFVGSSTGAVSCRPVSSPRHLKPYVRFSRIRLSDNLLPSAFTNDSHIYPANKNFQFHSTQTSG